MDIKVKLIFQLANSLDLNVQDLGCFNSIQSLPHRAAAANMKEVFLTMQQSFKDMHRSNLNNVFLTLREVTEMCILHNCNINYEISYLSEAKLERERTLMLSATIR